MLNVQDIRLPETTEPRIPIAMQVFSRLRYLILTLVFKPSEALSEKELSLRLGTSRTPVREALIRLADEGLVDIFPQRGTFVAPIRIDEVKEAQFIRELLETAIIERAANHISTDYLDQIDEILQRQKFATKLNNHDETMMLDEKFHHTLCKSIKLPRAWKVIHTMKGQLDRVHYISYRMPGLTEEMIEQHTEIFEAVKNGDEKMAVDCMRNHLHGVWGRIELLTKENPELFER